MKKNDKQSVRKQIKQHKAIRKFFERAVIEYDNDMAKAIVERDKAQKVIEKIIKDHAKAPAMIETQTITIDRLEKQLLQTDLDPKIERLLRLRARLEKLAQEI